MTQLLGRLKSRNRSLVGSDIAILLTILLHLGEGITFAVTDKANGSIRMAALLMAAFGYRPLALVAMFSVCVIAAFGQWGRGINPALRFVMLLPQLLLLVITALGSAHAVIVSHYADGVVRPQMFILWDQIDRLLIVPIIYAVAIYARVTGPVD